MKNLKYIICALIASTLGSLVLCLLLPNPLSLFGSIVWGAFCGAYAGMHVSFGGDK